MAERIVILEALCHALDRRAEVLTAIAAALDDDEAAAAVRKLLNVPEIGARAVLELQFRRASLGERAKLQDQLAELRQQHTP